MSQTLIAQLSAAQEAAKLSNGAISRALGKDRSMIGRYKSGEAELSLPLAEQWAQTCGVELRVVAPHIAAVEELRAEAEELTREELAMLSTAARALLSSRGQASARAVVLAGLGIVAGQVEDKATGRLKLL